MDKIVSTVYYEGVVYVFTESGKVFEMSKELISRRIEFKIVHRLDIGLR